MRSSRQEAFSPWIQEPWESVEDRGAQAGIKMTTLENVEKQDFQRKARRDDVRTGMAYLRGSRFRKAK
jgi:hypothetical protein